MRVRFQQELEILRASYSDVEHKEHNGEDWFKLPAHPFPEGWFINDVPITAAPIVFKVSSGYHAQEPYGFLAPAGISFNGTAPTNASAANEVPFDGSWVQFSWAPDGTWTPTNDPSRGSNLQSWVWSFSTRLKQGV
jgi:hypothetical protein